MNTEPVDISGFPAKRKPLRPYRPHEVYQLTCHYCGAAVEIPVERETCPKCNGILDIQWFQGRAAAA